MNKFAKQTALGIITCNREDMLQELVKSIDPTNFNTRYIINNGASLKNNYHDYIVLNSKHNPTPVGAGKNKFFRIAKENHDYMFCLEDDIRIKNNDVWQYYIDTLHDSGIVGQLSYGMHGNNNTINETVEYTKLSVDFYQESYAAFTLFHKDIFKIVGYFNEDYINAGEHLEHYHRTTLKGGTPFRYFPDAHKSFEYIEDQDSGHDRSVIRSDKNWPDQFKKAWVLFRKTYGVYPNELAKCEREKLMSRLTEIEERFARKDLL